MAKHAAAVPWQVPGALDTTAEQPESWSDVTLASHFRRAVSDELDLGVDHLLAPLELPPGSFTQLLDGSVRANFRLAATDVPSLAKAVRQLIQHVKRAYDWDCSFAVTISTPRGVLTISKAAGQDSEVHAKPGHQHRPVISAVSFTSSSGFGEMMVEGWNLEESAFFCFRDGERPTELLQRAGQTEPTGPLEAGPSNQSSGQIAAS